MSGFHDCNDGKNLGASARRQKKTRSVSDKQVTWTRSQVAECPVAHVAASSNVLQLRDYQLTGLKWLIFNYYQRRPSILADEMVSGEGGREDVCK